TISPSTPQSVDHGATTTFTLTPAANYHVGTVTGTCGGSLAGNVYTTIAVNADCTVIASFAIDTHTVTPSVTGGNGTITPSTAQTVDHGATTSFTLTPAANYHVVTPVGGTCGGRLAGNVYTTNAVDADCTVVASFALDTHAVTPSVGSGNGTISPSTVQDVDHGATTTFTLTPASSYHVLDVTGTCGGSLAGNVFTTAAVTADCSVIANFEIDTHTVGGNVTGLLGSGLVLRLNGANDLPIPANGPFVFAQALDDLGAYAVTVGQQPSGPTQVCTVSNGSGTLAGADITNVVVACAPPVPHLAVTVTDNRDYVHYGKVLTYLVRVTNDGEGIATGVSVTNVSPPQIDTTSTTWACHGAGGGAVCRASGSGALADTGVAVPPGRTLTWVVSAPVRVDAPVGTIDYTVNVGGPSPATANDHDIIVILRTGMDVPYGDGAEGSAADESTFACAPAQAQRFDLSATRVFDLPRTAPLAEVETVLIARGEGSAGFRLERLAVDATPSLRLVASDRDGAERATAWAPVSADASLAIGIATGGSGPMLLLEGPQLSLELPLPDGIAPSIVAQTSPRACD
ncbi:MAG: InlB B-repeat-containing protein, partial [Dokdonella sp.]|uniref:InlB B-repeat-containing protein n=1 Tax=Dokdonella sp. TaxID=2291710 RepID=UPI003F7FD5EF